MNLSMFMFITYEAHTLQSESCVHIDIRHTCMTLVQHVLDTWKLYSILRTQKLAYHSHIHFRKVIDIVCRAHSRFQKVLEIVYSLITMDPYIA